MRTSELIDEVATLAAAQAGDRDAFGTLVQPHLATLRSLAYHMLTSREDPDDAVQEGLLRALTEIGGFRAEASPRTRLFRTVLNICLDVLRHSGGWRVDAHLNGSRIGRDSSDHLADLATVERDTEHCRLGSRAARRNHSTNPEKEKLTDFLIQYRVGSDKVAQQEVAISEFVVAVKA